MSPAQIGLTMHVPGKAGNQREEPKGRPNGGSPNDAESLKDLPLDCPSDARELKKLGYATGTFSTTVLRLLTVWAARSLSATGNPTKVTE